MSKKKKGKKNKTIVQIGTVDLQTSMNGGESPFGQSVNPSSSGWEPDRSYTQRVKDRIQELYEELEKNCGGKDV